MFKELVFNSVDDMELSLKKEGYEIVSIEDNSVLVADESYSNIYNLYLVQVMDKVVLI